MILTIKNMKTKEAVCISFGLITLSFITQYIYLNFFKKDNKKEILNIEESDIESEITYYSYEYSEKFVETELSESITEIKSTSDIYSVPLSETESDYNSTYDSSDYESE